MCVWPLKGWTNFDMNNPLLKFQGMHCLVDVTDNRQEIKGQLINKLGGHSPWGKKWPPRMGRLGN
jgi:hypothetical protein